MICVTQERLSLILGKGRKRKLGNGKVSKIPDLKSVQNITYCSVIMKFFGRDYGSESVIQMWKMELLRFQFTVVQKLQ